MIFSYVLTSLVFSSGFEIHLNQPQWVLPLTHFHPFVSPQLSNLQTQPVCAPELFPVSFHNIGTLKEFSKSDNKHAISADQTQRKHESQQARPWSIVWVMTQFITTFVLLKGLRRYKTCVDIPSFMLVNKKCWKRWEKMLALSPIRIIIDSNLQLAFCFKKCRD